MSFMENSPSSGHLKLEENVPSEDLINSKEGQSEHECFINQRTVASGDVSTIKDQVSSADQLQELSCVPSEESGRLQETLNPVVDSGQYPDKIKETDLRESCIGETRSYWESGTIKWITDGTVCNSEILQDMDTAISQLHDPCEEDLLNPKEHPMDQEECCTPNNNGLYAGIKGNDCQEENNLKDDNMSTTNLTDESTDITQLVDLIGDHTDASTESQGSIDLYNHIDSKDCNETRSPANKQAKHLENSHYDNDTGTHKIASDVDHLDISANRSSEGAKTMKIHSLDFYAKNSAVGFSRTNNSRNGKRKAMPQIPICRKSGPHYETEMVSHKLEFVEEENLSEQEESSEDDNVDHSLPCSRDRLDHRKERHQYVSDQLDPDVLHLLEMHLRKQQLVEIKEEKEEELLDVHINKEKSRSESFKLLRNISPVLDMVLEEPELEHSGDTLDESSQTSSDTDSDDDSSNSCEVEMDLMESLQHDLMSKSSKIGKHEIARILQTPSSDLSTRENKGKQKAALCDGHDGKITFETTENKEPKAFSAGTGDSSHLHMAEMENSVDGNFTSGFNSESTAVENGHVLVVRSDVDDCDSWKELTEVSMPGPGKDSMEEPHHSYHCSSIESGNKDLNVDVNHRGTSDTAAYVTYTGTALTESREGAFTESESVRIGDTSKEQCPTLDGNPKPHDIIVPSLDGNMSLPPLSKSTDNCFPKLTDNCISEEVSSEHDDDGKSLGGEDICETGLKEELKSVIEGASSEPSRSSAEMSTLQLDLEEKILSILEKAHAADCRSSHLQAGAELLWKESIELRNECKSLSKEAAELLSIFKKQNAAVPRQPRRQGSHRTKSLGEFLSTTDTKTSSKETLHLGSKNDSRSINKGEGQLQFLGKKYNFLREEAPEIMRELQVLQQDLKGLPSHHSKPMSILYSLLWGGLMTGGALLLVWWSTKQLG